MSEYVHMFVGPPGVPIPQLLADVEFATGLQLDRSSESDSFDGEDETRLVRVFTDGNIYEDEPHLPFSAHPVQIDFHTAEKTIESERRFLDETFRRLRDMGRYTLFAAQGVQARIDPD